MSAPPFKGVIKLDVRDSKPDWTPYTLKRAPAGAPNILIVLYDDTGLAAWVAVRRSDKVSEEYASPGTFTGGRILGVGIDVGKDAYLDLERLAAAALARD